MLGYFSKKIVANVIDIDVHEFWKNENGKKKINIRSVLNHF